MPYFGCFPTRITLCLIMAALCLLPAACEKRKERIEKRREQQAESTQAAATPTPSPTPTPCPRPEPRMAEGSFNPNVPAELKMKLGDKPEAVVGDSAWRERYRPLLEASLTHSNPAGFYVYPFLDRTPCGVGRNCTYGGHLAGMAALAAWTDARLTGMGQPRHYGIPLAGPEGDFKLPTREEWLARALADPVTAEADVILTGFYEALEDGPPYDPNDPMVAGPGRPGLRIVMIERGKPQGQRMTELFVDEQAKAFTFEELSAQQRRGIRAMADRLIASGALAVRPVPVRGDLDLDTELREVARLLDTSDSWGLMEGIDRALQLTAVFPEDTAPLQAASYGLNVLAWGYFIYAHEDEQKILYNLRAYALSQVALAMNMRPDLSQLNWMASCVSLEHKPYQRKTSLRGEDTTRENIDLCGYRQYIFGNFDPILTEEQLAIFPRWQMLRQENRLTWFYGHSGYRHRNYFEQHLPYWQLNDLFTEVQRKYVSKNDYGGKQFNGLEIDRIKAQMDMQVTMGSELAALLTLAPDQAFKAQVLADLGGDALAGAIISAMPDDGLTTASLKAAGGGVTDLANFVISAAANPGSYYELRRSFINAMSAAGVPLNGDHPAYQILGKLKVHYESLRGQPQSWQAPSGYRGFEFTPAERIGFYHYRDYLFSIYAHNYWAFSFSDVDGMLALVRTIDKIYPDHHFMNYCLGFGYFNHRSEKKDMDLAAMAADCFRKSYESFPLSNTYLERWARNRFFFHNQPAAGATALNQYIRLDPFDISLNEKISDLAYRYNFRKLALKYYERNLKIVPDQYMLRNDWAYTMCQIGLADDSRVHTSYTDAPWKLTGNDRLWKDAIDYFVLWRKDFDSARNYAIEYRKNRKDSNDPIIKQAWVEYKAGYMDRAVHFANQMKAGDRSGLGLAIFEAHRGSLYLDYGRLDMAEPHILKAASVSPWQGNVIIAMGDLERARGQYNKAFMEYERFLGRYGEADDVRAKIALTYRDMGEWDKAVTEMEKVVFKDNPQEVHAEYVIDLLKIYNQTGETGKARKAMAVLLASGGKDRLDIIEALDVLEKIDADLAGKIRAHLNEIMAGPDRFDQIQDWPGFFGI